ncbi:hypothetical protein B0H16DRAFT_1700664 [Mycena metata]|uniref:Stealth protein CR3 conserved region 3 domain-containing protein n=1 Tax=Mycena metata TaxID=1033252 RepID=A0AAD7HDT0_9AGAR|nr:hypothetical protein B0H16DRAFT_1700664 [Mycena metata]
MRYARPLLSVALYVLSLGGIVFQRRWRFVIVPVVPTTPLIVKPLPDVIRGILYDTFIAPSPKEAIADHRYFPLRCIRITRDALHQKARKELLHATRYRTKEARFREHDELRYSLRSVRNATATWPNSTWHIVTADIPEPSANDTALDRPLRLGQVPQWLDIECAFDRSADGQPPIRWHHHSQLFRLTARLGIGLMPTNVSDWLGRILPSFNSFAIESQLPQLDPAIVSDNIIAMNDDQFMMLPHPPSYVVPRTRDAFHTTLYGPVFRVDPDLLVTGDDSGSADGGGEWRSLHWNERFGTRTRPYLHHNARALSLPLMHELSLAFGQYFAATPLSRFRGSHEVPGEYELNTIFMATYYAIERHREALLWSWVVGKWGGSSGVLDSDRKWQMWRDMGGGEVDVLSLPKVERTTAEDLDVNLYNAGVQPPWSFDDRKQADVSYVWLSMDGYTPEFHAMPKKVEINRIIAALIRTSERGLRIFLPPPSVEHEYSNTDPIILPLDLPVVPPSLPRNPRAFAVRLLMRYAYVLGESTTLFMPMKSVRQAGRALRNADRRKNLALMCINDDLHNGDQTAADSLLRGWFESRWPERLDYSRAVQDPNYHEAIIRAANAHHHQWMHGCTVRRHHLEFNPRKDALLFSSTMTDLPLDQNEQKMFNLQSHHVSERTLFIKLSKRHGIASQLNCDMFVTSVTRVTFGQEKKRNCPNRV